jgi:hypothetical protein
MRQSVKIHTIKVLSLRHKRDIADTRGEPLGGGLPTPVGGTTTASGGAAEVKGPWNANRRSRFVELVIVVDNRKYKENDSDLGKVTRKAKEMANIANALYAPLNIYIALVGKRVRKTPNYN